MENINDQKQLRYYMMIHVRYYVEGTICLQYGNGNYMRTVPIGEMLLPKLKKTTILAIIEILDSDARILTRINHRTTA